MHTQFEIVIWHGYNSLLAHSQCTLGRYSTLFISLKDHYKCVDREQVIIWYCFGARFLHSHFAFLVSILIAIHYCHSLGQFRLNRMVNWTELKLMWCDVFLRELDEHEHGNWHCVVCVIVTTILPCHGTFNEMVK